MPAFNFNKSWLGSNLKRGVGETFGFHYERIQKGPFGIGSEITSGGFLNYKGIGSEYQKQIAAGTKGGKAALRASGKAFVPGLSLLFSAHSIYSGFKEGGFSGGMGAATEAVAFNTGLSMLGGAAGTLLGGVMAIGAAGVGLHALGKAAETKKKRTRGLELAAVSPDLLYSSSSLTARQRSLQALNDSRINARMAIGNEAALMHTRYR